MKGGKLTRVVTLPLIFILFVIMLPPRPDRSARQGNFSAEIIVTGDERCVAAAASPQES